MMEPPAPKRRFSQQLTRAAKVTGEMKSNAPILFRLIDDQMKIVEDNRIVFFVEITAAYTARERRMVGTPFIGGIEIAADADAQSGFNRRLSFGDAAVENPHSPVQA